MSDSPSPPDSLPKYISEGLPKQDDETLRSTKAFIDELLEFREQQVKTELPDNADVVSKDSGGKGTIVEEMVTCGDDSCHCAEGELHGPYRYRYYYEGGSLTSEYLGAVD